MPAERLINMTPIITGIIRTRIASKEVEIMKLLKQQQQLGFKRDQAMTNRHRASIKIYGDRYDATFFTLDSKQDELTQLKWDFKRCLAKLSQAAS